MHQSHPPTAGCQEWALGPSQRGQQGTEPSKLAKAQRGNFLERYGDVTEQGSELLVGQVGITARMNRAGDQEVSQAPHLSTELSGSLCRLSILSHLTICLVSPSLCLFSLSLSPSPSGQL